MKLFGCSLKWVHDESSHTERIRFKSHFPAIWNSDLTMAASPATAVAAPPASTAMGTRPPVRARGSPKRPPAQVRARLNKAQKLEICEYKAANPTLGWDELAVWAGKHFKLRRPLSTSTIGHILRSYETLKKLSPQELLAKNTVRNEAWQMLESQLRDWVVRLAGQGMHIDGRMIKGEAERIRAELKDEKLDKIQFSNGWLASFQERHKISLTSLHSGGSVIAPDRPKRQFTKKSQTTKSNRSVRNKQSN